MPINELKNSVINKLLQQSNKIAPLVFNSDSAIKKQKELKNLLKTYNINNESVIVLGTFLQSTELSIFTEKELLHLLSYEYKDIEHSKVINNSYKYDKPLYDLNNTLINYPLNLNNISSDFLKLQGINKNLSINFLVNYLIAQS